MMRANADGQIFNVVADAQVAHVGVESGHNPLAKCAEFLMRRWRKRRDLEAFTKPRRERA